MNKDYKAVPSTVFCLAIDLFVLCISEYGYATR